MGANPNRFLKEISSTAVVPKSLITSLKQLQIDADLLLENPKEVIFANILSHLDIFRTWLQLILWSAPCTNNAATTNINNNNITNSVRRNFSYWAGLWLANSRTANNDVG